MLEPVLAVLLIQLMFLGKNQKPATRFRIAGSVGSDGHGTLGGYVIWGEQSEYRHVIEAVFSLKKAA
jgi:hypothetical protein